MPNCCICYITDSNYLFPSFVSATQARRNTPEAVADVLIFGIDISLQEEVVFARAGAIEGIQLISVPSSLLDGAGAMLARLFLDRFVPDDYDKLLYIDGDTQILGALSPLLQLEVPSGQFCAASDPMAFTLRGTGPAVQRLENYFSALGLSDVQQQNYFNSGVLLINRNGWDEIGQAAWTEFKKLRDLSRYPDQDALNIAGADRRIPISFAWNFPIFLRNACLESKITPRIIHYMGSPKPWHGPFPPWGEAEYDTYLAVARRHMSLVPFLTNMPRSGKVKYFLQQRCKQIQELATWGHGYRHREILHYERSMGSALT